MSSLNAQFAAEILAYRHSHVTDAARAVLDAGHPADTVARAAFLAGLEWDEIHPLLASRAAVAQ